MGEHFFKEYTFRNESQLRIGRSANVNQYIEKVYDEHVSLTTKINLFSQLPLVLFCLRYIWNGSGELLASFFGLTQGLIGLSGTLAFQRSRVTALRTTQTAKHLISALTSDAFIISPKRWQEHIQLPQNFPAKTVQQNFSDGVYFLNFSSQILQKISETAQLPPITYGIPYKGTLVLHAPSGQGKSTFLLALSHFIEHSGELFFVNNGHWQNAHSFSLKDLRKQIYFSREENFDKSARLIDMFKEPLQFRLKNILQEMITKFGEELVCLAWKSSDNLIEQEIHHLDQCLQSIFPKKMIESLKEMRAARILELGEILKTSGGNLSTSRIFPERVFASLSAGEKRRIMGLLALENVQTNSTTRFMVLDEPFSHLDEKNIEWQVKTINKMHQLSTPPAILIISHQFNTTFLNSLQNVKTLNLMH